MTTPSDRSPEDRRPRGDGSPHSAGGSGQAALSGCQLFESVAPELALGSLAGAERSTALAHLDDCPSCRQLLEELTAAADSLLLVAAEADPPAGFEVRLLERLKGSVPTAAAATSGAVGGGRSWPVTSIEGRRARPLRHFSMRARTALAAAAVAVAAAGVGLGLEVAPRAAPSVSAGGQIRVTSLHTGSGPTGSPAGEVVITAGRPTWVLMSVKVHAAGWVTCELDLNGKEVPIGTFQLYDGKGSWAAPVRHSGAAATSARLVDASGRVLASADFET